MAVVVEPNQPSRAKPRLQEAQRAPYGALVHVIELLGGVSELALLNVNDQ